MLRVKLISGLASQHKALLSTCQIGIKRRLFMGLGLFFALPALHAQVSFTLKGKLNSLTQPTELYIGTYTYGNKYEVIDTVLYDNGFVFKGQSSDLGMFVLQSKSPALWIPFIAESGDIKITEKNGNGTVEGGLQNKLLYACIDIDSQFDQQTEKFLKLSDSAKAQGNKNAAAKYDDSVSALQTQKHVEMDSFYVQHPDGFVALSNLWGIKQLETTKYIENIFNRLSLHLQHHPLGVELKKYIEEMKLPSAPVMYLKDTSSSMVFVNFPAYRYNLLEFWSSTSTPSRKNHTRLKSLYKKYKDLGLMVIGISGDEDASSWKSAIRKDSLEWLNRSDLKGPSGKYFRLYHVQDLPTYIIVDRNGKLIGNKEQDINKVQSTLDALFKEPSEN